MIAFDLERWAPGVLAALIAGASLGFLLYNFPPASSFMGDCGANLLGLLMGCLTVEGAVKTEVVLSFVLPLILLAVPFLDTTFVVLKRLKYRRPIYASDSEHFHHRMARIGFSRRRTIAYLYGWTLLLAGFALALRFVPYSDHKGHLYLGWTLVIVALALFVAVASVYLVYVLEILKFRRLDAIRLRRLRPEASPAQIEQDVTRGLRDGRVPDDRLVKRAAGHLGRVCARGRAGAAGGGVAASAGAGASSAGAPAASAARRRPPPPSKIGQHALVVGIGEQHPAMFGDPRFKALAIRYARISIGWNALESRSRVPGARHLAARCPRRRRAPADLLRTLLDRRTRSRRLPTRRRIRPPVPAAARALPVGDRLRGVERGQLLRAAHLPLALAWSPPTTGSARRLPLLQRARLRAARRAGDGHVGRRGAPRARLRTGDLGSAQLHRRQPPLGRVDQGAAGRHARRRSGSPRRAAWSPATTTPPTTSPNRPRHAAKVTRFVFQPPRPALPAHRARLPLPVERRHPIAANRGTPA